MNLSDQISRPRGVFTLNVFRAGQLIETFVDDNLVVDASKAVLARLIGGDFTDRNITQISFGTNGTAPAAGNTSITNPYTKGVDSVSYPVAGSVEFAFSLASGEANGKAIMEFGLLTNSGVLFARKTRSIALNKESDLAFSGTWRITF